MNTQVFTNGGEGMVDDNFWEKLSNERKILKWKGKANDNFNEEYLELLKAYDSTLKKAKPLTIGQIIKGTIESISKREIIVDFGYKDTIFVDNKDHSLTQHLNPGDEVDVLITKVQDRPYQIKGSISELIKMNVHTKMKDYFHEETALTGKVISKIAAGFLVDVRLDGIEINTFMPNTLAAPNKLTDEQSDELVGQEIQVCLETLQQERGFYVVSRKKFLDAHMFEDELHKLKKGKLYKGHVTGTTPFGVFVQFNGCLTGMIHKANIGDSLKSAIKETEGVTRIDVKAGTEVEFYVKDIAKKGRQIILTQILRESVWDKIRVGQEYDATVISVKNFGVLVSLDEETLGLIQNTYIQKSGKTFVSQEKVKVKVISVIKDDRKIYLDLV